MTPEIFWLASYPKSGNTWFRAVYTSWRTGMPVDLNRLHTEGTGPIASSRARIESALGVPTSLLTADEVDLLRPRVDEMLSAGDVGPSTGETAGGTLLGREGRAATIIKIHDALLPGPAGELIVSGAATLGAIYLVRDPRDVVVSFANHSRSSHEQAVRYMGDAAACLSTHTQQLTSQVRQRLATWSTHVSSWLDAPFPVHVVRYEDCIADPVATFTTALRFVGCRADPGDVAPAVERVRFERLRAQEEESGFREKPAGVQAFFRRGETGGWRNALEPDLVARIEWDHGDVMRRCGYSTTDGSS